MLLPAIEAEGAGRLAVGDAAASYDPIVARDITKALEDGVAAGRHITKAHEGFSVSCPGLPGCWSQGETETEALANIQDAIREYLAAIDDLVKGQDVREVSVVV